MSAVGTYNGFTLTNVVTAANKSRGTTVSLLDGTASVARNVVANFQAAPTVSQGVRAFSDAVDFSGTANAGSSLGDKFVIQFTLDETAVLAAGLTDASMSLKWLDPRDGQFKEAYLGDSDGGAAHQFLIGQYLSGTEFQLGNYGVDPLNHTVWAVLDHNSVFVAGMAVPEPSSWQLLSMAVILLGITILRQRQRSTKSSHPLGRADVL
ncbi:MAG: hypothetical protein INR62_04580 [Rhodospirillales bacterium]|nr:hypothetical protein [Acetobacter sp.]